MSSVEEKQARSVFVGNIPHGTTEEQMKEYFADVGTVLSFRIVYDRETGNPKGYGFAEYLDTEMAQSAIRNLNGREFSGRVLRVDKASSQADELRMIHQQSGGPPIENPYGETVAPDKAPEAISRAVASLPPEQMFELMKQMKQCIQNNPNEARTMLLNNPQLAYALLQAQVVMKIVDPQVAQTLLHRKPEPIVLRPIAPLQPSIVKQQPQAPIVPTPVQAMPLMPNTQTIQLRPTINVPVQQAPPAHPQMLPRPVFTETLIDPRFQAGSVQNRPIPQPVPLQPGNLMATAARSSTQQQQQQISPGAQANQQLSADQEKAALIMQVLQLRDDQIAMLPQEQRNSILTLKNQIAQSAGGILPNM